MRKQLITLKIISHTMTTFLKKALFVIVAFVCAFQLSAQTAADGFAAMQLEDWDKAISIYGELVKKDPVDQASWLSLGSAYTLKGDKAKAKEAYDAAFNAKPEGAYGFIANARNAFLQNNITVVDEQLKKATKAGKKDPVAMRLIGETYLFTEPGVKPNFVRAEALLKEARSGKGVLYALLNNTELRDNLVRLVANLRQRGLLFYKDKDKEPAVPQPANRPAPKSGQEPWRSRR